jgi:hypothetical protein
VQLAQGGRDGNRTDRAPASGGEAGGELVDALGPTVAQEQQNAPGRRSQRDSQQFVSSDPMRGLTPHCGARFRTPPEQG